MNIKAPIIPNPKVNSHINPLLVAINPLADFLPIKAAKSLDLMYIFLSHSLFFICVSLALFKALDILGDMACIPLKS